MAKAGDGWGGIDRQIYCEDECTAPDVVHTLDDHHSRLHALIGTDEAHSEPESSWLSTSLGTDGESGSTINYVPSGQQIAAAPSDPSAITYEDRGVASPLDLGWASTYSNYNN
eukprot:scaffold1722_cov380-Prasinococcus_capsulatus_cf.AAC.5